MADLSLFNWSPKLVLAGLIWPPS